MTPSPQGGGQIAGGRRAQPQQRFPDRTINRIGVILALVALVVLFVEYLLWVVVGLLIALAGYLLYQRIEEYRA